MTTVKVYPRTIKTTNEFRALDIDGRVYLGVTSAISQFLADSCMKIKDVEWLICDEHKIVATSLDDFWKQFQKLGIDFKGV